MVVQLGSHQSKAGFHLCIHSRMVSYFWRLQSLRKLEFCQVPQRNYKTRSGSSNFGIGLFCKATIGFMDRPAYRQLRCYWNSVERRQTPMQEGLTKKIVNFNGQVGYLDQRSFLDTFRNESSKRIDQGFR